MYVYVSVCVCVCERKRERERDCLTYKDKKYRERLTETIHKEYKDTLIERDKLRHK